MRLQKTLCPCQNLKYTLWFPLYLLFFLLLEQRSVNSYWATQLPLDALIPFCEWFVIPYCLWYPLLVAIGVYLLRQDSPAFRRYMTFLAITFLTSELIWFLVPNGQDLRPTIISRNNLLTRIMEILYGIDTNTNVFPSVHVVGAVGAALAIWDYSRLRKKRALFFTVVILAALICLSVVFVKQHALIDLVGGLILSALAALWVYRPQKSR